VSPPDVNEWAWLEAILDGIDKDEAEDGWWETSTGAEFGARKLVELKEAITARIAEIQRERDDHAHAAWLAQMRVAALEVAQRPPLGYAAVTPVGSIQMDSLTDRATAERKRAECAAANPQPGWCVVELREVQP
jgi:hypothetical protein